MKSVSKIFILSIIVLSFSFSCNSSAADDFTHTLALAKHSSCSYIAAKFDALSRFDGFGNFVLKELKKKEKGLFPWRFEITNGYQEGFVYYALKGIALENKGDIIAAYNAYQNSLFCIDDKASFAHRNPRHEIELAIGRIYLKCGRYYDAYNVFDTVRLESHNKNILIAADEGLINRAIAIGDYKEACEMYEDLGTMTTLTREQFNGYAKVLFSLNRDRDAFAQLLYGIAKYGFNEDLGARDPMIDLFLNALPRSNDEEIAWFYDLLGYGIADSRAQKGDENYLAFLCKCRALLTTILPHLQSEDDIKTIFARIMYLKTNIIYHSATRFTDSLKQRTNSGDKAFTKQTGELIDSNSVPTTSIVDLENMLMHAEICIKSGGIDNNPCLLFKRFAIAYTNALLVDISLKNTIYDNTTMERMWILAKLFADMYHSDLPKQNLIRSELKQIILPLSSKEAELLLRLHIMISSPIEDVKFLFDYMPNAHPLILFYLEKLAMKEYQKGNLEKALMLSDEYRNRCGFLTADMYYKTIQGYAACGRTTNAFNIVLQALQSFDPFRLNADSLQNDSYWFRQYCRNMSSWATITDIQNFNRIQLLAEAVAFIKYYHPSDSMVKLREAIHWQKRYGKFEIAIKNSFANRDVNNNIYIITNKFTHCQQAGHDFILALSWVALGDTNKAYSYMMTAYEKRIEIAGTLRSSEARYPTLESQYIELWIAGFNQKIMNDYLAWLRKKVKICKELERYQDSKRATISLQIVKRKLEKL